MDKLREKIAKLLLQQEFNTDDEMTNRDWERMDEQGRDDWLKDANQILTLFQTWLKEQVDGLEVMRDEELYEMGWRQYPDKSGIPLETQKRRAIAQAQLQDVKDKLLRRME